MRPFPPAWPRSAWVLLAANLVPLAGVLALRWDLGAVMALFWAENVVIGAYHILRLAIVARWAGLFFVPFFTVHYGIFTAVHGLFVLTLFVADASGTLRAVAVGVVVLVASHGYSFVTNAILGGELKDLKPGDAGHLMVAPYRRVVVLHLAILGGGFLLVLLGSPLPALVLLVALKTGVDLWAHLREHVRPPPAATAQ